MLTGTISVGGRTAQWWFTDRTGGESTGVYGSRNLAAHVGDDPVAVRANRENLAKELGLPAISWMGPVHGVDIAVLSRAAALTPNVDALATAEAQTPIATLGADCVPVLIVARDLIVAAHVGWQGFVDGMADQLLALFKGRDIDPREAHVVLGPAICGSCYPIPVQRAERIAQASLAASVIAANGEPGADIRLGLADQWTAQGARVEIVGGCTHEDGAFFSHRRDGVTGRQAGVIAWMN